MPIANHRVLFYTTHFIHIYTQWQWSECVAHVSLFLLRLLHLVFFFDRLSVLNYNLIVKVYAEQFKWIRGQYDNDSMHIYATRANKHLIIFGCFSSLDSFSTFATDFFIFFVILNIRPRFAKTRLCICHFCFCQIERKEKKITQTRTHSDRTHFAHIPR